MGKHNKKCCQVFYFRFFVVDLKFFVFKMNFQKPLSVTENRTFPNCGFINT